MKFLKVFLNLVTFIFAIDKGSTETILNGGVNYAFKYEVDVPKFNIVTNHWEKREENQVIGSYSLLQPDGRVRVVQYEVNGRKGFQAYVTYRKPPGPMIRGHLRFPWEYRKPVWLAKPVGFITTDLFSKTTVPYPFFRN